ncbi:putative salivary secreted peptide [Colletes latitarsis]|uniref:putative salivary secreted peptide n=1 Tax=Colletes latitarsis TaxID=2605962 RepID=UPI0040359414
MTTQKTMLYLTILVIAVSATEVNSLWGSNNNGNKSHNLIVGYRMSGDRLVLRQNVIKNSAWMRIVVEEKTFNTSMYDRITTVQALDQKTNGNGAYASLTAGGPGYSFVTLRFKSQRSHGINFVVELYARP